MSVLSGQEIQFTVGSTFSQAFTCSLADLIGTGYPPTDIETFATEGATAAITYGRRGDPVFRTECDATVAVSGNIVTLGVSTAEIASMTITPGYFTIDVSNGVERWRVVSGTWHRV